MEREQSPEIEKPVELNFIYNIKNEVKRLQYVAREKEFYKKHGYKVSVPQGIKPEDLESMSEDQLKSLVTAELNQEKVDQYSLEIKAAYDENQEGFQRALKRLTKFSAKPADFNIVFSQYGTGGSYNPPNRVILNINGLKSPFEVVVHEIVHCFIEDSIIQKLQIEHTDKEKLVDWYIANDPDLSAIFPEYGYQRFGKPKEELLRKVGFI